MPQEVDVLLDVMAQKAKNSLATVVATSGASITCNERKHNMKRNINGAPTAASTSFLTFLHLSEGCPIGQKLVPIEEDARLASAIENSEEDSVEEDARLVRKLKKTVD